jgi:SAM-dependent methyltransferase
MIASPLRRLIRRVIRRPRNFPAATSPAVREVLDQLAERDRWFYDHFIKAPQIVADFLARVVPLERSVVLDFGCGQGVMAKGVARSARQVHGVDVSAAFETLEERFEKIFGSPHLFPPVELRQVCIGAPLPYRDGAFDAAFAWSVFEHVADVPYALSEIHRVIRPGGAFLLQISPLYYSAHGGHLWNILDEPWIHLRLGREELLDRACHVSLDGIRAEDRHNAFQGKSAEDYRAGVIACQDSLNRITVGELGRHVRDAGFAILQQLTMPEGPEEVPSDLLERYPREDLTIGQVVLLMTR